MLAGVFACIAIFAVMAMIIPSSSISEILFGRDVADGFFEKLDLFLANDAVIPDSAIADADHSIPDSGIAEEFGVLPDSDVADQEAVDDVAEEGDEIQIPEIVNGTWRVDHELGEGSFGVVFMGTDIVTGEEVAIKMESSDEKPRLKLEARLYRRLSGGGMVPFLTNRGLP
jgi:hypothetical protein